jgi:transcriptional regulator with XRE-family HTH domain
MTEASSPVGELIRQWRARRRMSQIDLAGEAEISQRHLSFIESGRARPSRDMVLNLSERLELPLRQRNSLLRAAGFAPSFEERRLDDPSLAPAMDAVRRVLAGHEPNPALAVDRHWNLVMANAALDPFLKDIAEPALLKPPVNVLRLSLHPKGLAPCIVNLAEWRAHLLERLRRLIDSTVDPELEALEAELLDYPSGVSRTRPVHDAGSAIVHPMRIEAGGTVLSLISTITVFGTPLDVTLSELAIESFFPADEATRLALQRMATGQA